MLNKAFRNNGFVVSVGNGLGTSLFPCPAANIFLRQQTDASGVNWSGCGNYGYSDTSVATYNYFTDGNCGEYWTLAGTWNRPSGDILYSTDCCQVIWNGSTYYVNDNCNPCGEANTPTGQTRQVNQSQIQWFGCGSDGWFTYSADIESEYHDGTCGTYWMLTGTFTADDWAVIYSYNDCCYVYYRQMGNTYEIYDGCGCPSSGTLLRSESSDTTLYWSGCGSSGDWAYSTSTTNYYADGNCGEYSAGGVYEQPVGTMIYDNGCCTVTYAGSGYYSVNDNCGSSYPPAGEILNSGSDPIQSQLTWGQNLGQNNYEWVTVGNNWWQEVADGAGGSYYYSVSNYLEDGTNVFTEPYGISVDLNWYADVNGTTASGTITYANEVGNWTLNSGEPSRTSTSIVDILTDGYIIYESDSWWNGDANVKVQITFQSGGGYITNTITF